MSDQLRSKVDLLFKVVLAQKLQERLEKAQSRPNDRIRQVADQYAAQRGIQLNHGMAPVRVDPKRAEKIALAYHQMKHDPSHPDVKSAYDALVRETGDQYAHIKNTGLKIEPMPAGMENPYKNGSKDLFHDIENNNHMWYYPTESGYGSGGASPDAHPLLQTTQHQDEHGKPMMANDMFRIVHDYFGHAKEGFGFGPNGEENAWRHHMQMYSPEAQKALTSETRGQNSWVSFGPHGEHNRANPHQTIYADQKAGLLPDHAYQTVTHNALEDDVQKSEDLRKAPLAHYDYDYEDPEKHSHDYNIFNDGKEYKLLHNVKLPNGLQYRQYQHKRALPGENRMVHTLYHPGYDTNVAMLETANERDEGEQGGWPNKVEWSEVHPLWRGKSLGRQAYMAALLHGKGMEQGLSSDAYVSPEAHKAWLSFRAIPGLTGKIGKYETKRFTADHPSSEDRHYVQVADRSKIRDSSVFRGHFSDYMPKPEKLAASEKLYKAPLSERVSELHDNWTGSTIQQKDRDQLHAEMMDPKHAKERGAMLRGLAMKVPTQEVNGERHYYLHRRHGPIMGDSVTHDKTTSYSTKPKDKMKFILDGGNIHGAWIPESKISYSYEFSLPHHQVETDYSHGHEGEVIVGPGTYPVADKFFQTSNMELPVPGHRDDSKLAASEKDLAKGVMRRVAPFNPKQVQPEDQAALREWQTYGQDYAPYDENPWDAAHNPDLARQGLSVMHPHAKARALHKLHSKAKSRRNPETGEREFLLHRGVSKEEGEWALDNGRAGYGERTSWTADPVTAHEFAKDPYWSKGPDSEMDEEPSDKLQPGGIISAWVPESKIMHVPRQYGELGTIKRRGENEYAKEQEVIADPHTFEVHAYTPHDQFKPREWNKLAASEPDYVGEPIVGRYKDFPHIEKDYGHSYLMWPVTINDETRDPVTGHRYHITLRHAGEHPPSKHFLDYYFGPTSHMVPDKFELQPHIFDTPNGRYHVLKMTKHPQWMQDVHKGLEEYLGPDKFPNYIPHISVPKHVYDRFIADPSSIKVQTHPIEMWKEGETLWRAPRRLAASEYQREDLGKGLRGDWQKEGYILKHRHFMAGDDGEGNSEPYIEISAHDKDGNVVGHAHFQTSGQRLYPTDTDIDKNHRRKGLGSAMYSHAEQLTGKKVMPSDSQSPDAQKFWDQPQIPFGRYPFTRSEDLEEDLQKSKNVREQRADVFGTKDQPPAGSDMREKHMKHISKFAQDFLQLKIHPSGGKWDEKKNKRRPGYEKPGEDKPDWRSGKLEAQWNPNAMIHEIAHLMLLPKGIGLKGGQAHMDKQYAEIQQKYGYLKQKRHSGEVQPMAAEQLIRRYLGLPANKYYTEAEGKDAPPYMSVEDPPQVIGTRVDVGKKKEKWVDLVRQSRFLTPENRQRIEDVLSRKIIFHPVHGWIDNPEHARARQIEERRQKATFGDKIRFKDDDDKLAASEQEEVDLTKEEPDDVE